MSTATEAFHKQLERLLAELQTTEMLDRDHAYRAALEVDLTWRPPVVVRCDIDPACQRTVGRIYRTSLGPLWVPTRAQSSKDDIEVRRLELLEQHRPRLTDEFAQIVFLGDCRDHPRDLRYGASVAVLLAAWDRTQSTEPAVRATLGFIEVAHRL